MTENEFKKVAQLLLLFSDFPGWTKDKRNILELACRCMESGRHKYFRSDTRTHRASAVGSYYIENKDHKRRGELFGFRGSKVMVMCVGYGKFNARWYLAAAVD